MSGCETDPRELLAAAVELLVRDRKAVVLPIVGRSMRPTLSDGDEVLVGTIPDRLERGDLVVVRDARGLVVHRHVGAGRALSSEEPVVCRGDGREDLDPPFASTAVVGRAVALRRHGSWWSLEGTAARRYAKALACHAVFWSAAIARVGPGRPAWWRRLLGGLDRFLLRATDLVLFRLVHGRRPPPRGDGESA